jgi:hypothetical protein
MTGLLAKDSRRLICMGMALGRFYCSFTSTSTSTSTSMEPNNLENDGNTLYERGGMLPSRDY